MYQYRGPQKSHIGRSLLSSIWCFLQVCVFLPLCSTSVWLWPYAVVPDACFTVFVPLQYWVHVPTNSYPVQHCCIVVMSETKTNKNIKTTVMFAYQETYCNWKVNINEDSYAKINQMMLQWLLWLLVTYVCQDQVKIQLYTRLFFTKGVKHRQLVSCGRCTFMILKIQYADLCCRLQNCINLLIIHSV